MKLTIMVIVNNIYKLKYETEIFELVVFLSSTPCAELLNTTGSITKIRIVKIKPNLKNICTEKRLLATKIVIKNITALLKSINLSLVSLLNRYKTKPTTIAANQSKLF